MEGRDGMFKEQPLISVIVPVYGVERSLNECVISIVKQTYRSLDIILVDDGSPDLCPEMCDQWAAKDSRIRVIHQHNAGPSAARNAGIDASHGEYIGFVDPDDHIAADMYETLLNNLLRERADVSIIGTSLVGENGEAYIPCETQCHLRMDSARAFKYVNLPGYFHVAVWDKLYRRVLFREIRFPENLLSGEDYYVTYRILDSARTLVYDSAPKYFYQLHEQVTLRLRITTAQSDETRIALKLVQVKYPQSYDYMLYGHLIATVGNYNNIILQNQRGQWKEFERRAIRLARHALPRIMKLPEIPKIKYAQMLLLCISPALYRATLIAFKRSHVKALS